MQNSFVFATNETVDFWAWRGDLFLELLVNCCLPSFAVLLTSIICSSTDQHAQSAMRSAIGEMELDEILHNRSRLNALIKGGLQEAALPWGLEVRRYEITEITPDHQIRIAMDKQAAAERDRRENVLRAEGDKRRAQLTSA